MRRAILFLIVLAGCAHGSMDQSPVADCNGEVGKAIAWATNDSVYEARWNRGRFEVVLENNNLLQAFSKYFSSPDSAREQYLLARRAEYVVVAKKLTAPDSKVGAVTVISPGHKERSVTWPTKARVLDAVPIQSERVATLEDSQRKGRGPLDLMAAAIGHPVPYSKLSMRTYTRDGKFVCESLVAEDIPYLHRARFLF